MGSPKEDELEIKTGVLPSGEDKMEDHKTYLFTFSSLLSMSNGLSLGGTKSHWANKAYGYQSLTVLIEDSTTQITYSPIHSEVIP